MLAALAFLLSAGCAAMGVAAGVATAERPPDPCPPSTASWRPDPTPMRAADPVELTIDRIDACSSLVPVGEGDEVDGWRRVAAPSVHAPEQAGWFRAGPTPGARGPAVLVGRVDGDGRRGVFAGLADATAGDRITVRRRDGSTAVFVVTGTVQVSPVKFPAREVHGDTGDAELRLIAYGGSAGDDLIVYARLSGQG
ncbi:class F sortase [Actinomycetospora chibensis]|uniref:Class F sortase n=1 Tax=Actinomycetospora chibensis TaxID=663606 RepID=A0ABV9RF03_9PSEU|nr:class F sortase [Actinomycetospora chibensis]MDD7925704.1 class F sortase [Actinomycetospora chibensis]